MNPQNPVISMRFPFSFLSIHVFMLFVVSMNANFPPFPISIVMFHIFSTLLKCLGITCCFLFDNLQDPPPPCSVL